MVTGYVVETGAGPLSGRIAGPTEPPRGLVVALHGGTYDSAFYDTGAGSLLAAGAALDLCVVALDRPGYGAATGIGPQWCSFEGQTKLLTEAIAAVIRDVEPAGTVLIGHSIGGMLALSTAAAGGVDLLGVEVSGIGAVWRPGMLEMWSSFIGDVPAIEVPAVPHAQVMFGPAGTYTEAQQQADAAMIRPMPMPELRDVVRWTDQFPKAAAAVSVPVSLTYPEHDNIWATDEAARSAAAGLFTAAPAVRVETLGGAGHSGELHKPARSYVLRQLAFVEACLAG